MIGYFERRRHFEQLAFKTCDYVISVRLCNYI